METNNNSLQKPSFLLSYMVWYGFSDITHIHILICLIPERILSFCRIMSTNLWSFAKTLPLFLLKSLYAVLHHILDLVLVRPGIAT